METTAITSLLHSLGVDPEAVALNGLMVFVIMFCLKQLLNYSWFKGEVVKWVVFVLSVVFGIYAFKDGGLLAIIFGSIAVWLSALAGKGLANKLTTGSTRDDKGSAIPSISDKRAGKLMSIIFLFLVLSSTTPAIAQTTDTTETGVQPSREYFQGVVMASTWSDRDFTKELDFGFGIGTVIKVPTRDWLRLRTVYNRWNYIPDNPIQMIETSLLFQWDVGRGWRFILIGGLDNYVSGASSGSDAQGGFGFQKRFYTYTVGDNILPGSLEMFFDVQWNDGAGQLNELSPKTTYQLNMGILVLPSID